MIERARCIARAALRGAHDLGFAHGRGFVVAVVVARLAADRHALARLAALDRALDLAHRIAAATGRNVVERCFTAVGGLAVAVEVAAFALHDQARALEAYRHGIVERAQRLRLAVVDYAVAVVVFAVAGLVADLRARAVAGVVAATAGRVPAAAAAAARPRAAAARATTAAEAAARHIGIGVVRAAVIDGAVRHRLLELAAIDRVARAQRR
jgi:hypothetical protein